MINDKLEALEGFDSVIQGVTQPLGGGVDCVPTHTHTHTQHTAHIRSEGEKETK